jgi:hypothetical protein
MAGGNWMPELIDIAATRATPSESPPPAPHSFGLQSSPARRPMTGKLPNIPVNSFANWIGSTRAIECDRSFVACDNVKACFGNAAFVQGCKEGRQQGFTYALR